MSSPEKDDQPLPEQEAGRFGRALLPESPDFDRLQQVEGFARTLSQPGIEPNYGRERARKIADFRGAGSNASTREWWRSRPDDEPDLVWLTASVPEAIDTTFTFAATSANLPDDLFPPHQATIYAGDQRLLSFELGIRERRVWAEGDWALEFIPKLLRTAIDGYHRQFEASGCSGLYRLAAPASALIAGQPLQLKIVLEPARSPAPHWFALLERDDLLAVTPESNAGQIEQLQQEVMRLKQIVSNLARRSYPELSPNRLNTEDVVIHTDGWRHVHPPDLELLANGDLLVCFREASEHISNDGQIVTVRSTDGGKTWGDRQVVRSHPYTDEREASIARLRDGTLLMNEWVNGNYDSEGRYHGVPVETYRGRADGVYIGRSTDHGHTWNWLSEQPLETAPFPNMRTSERIVELPSGDLLMATYTGHSADNRLCALYASSDGGETWSYRSTMGELPGILLGEPALIRTRTGRLIGVLRSDSGPTFYHTRSDDDGHTWTEAVSSGIPGRANPASLVVLPDGTILCIYASRHDVKGLYVVASHDDGVSWDLNNRRVIRDDFPNWDIGYPSSVLLPDGRVLASYYFTMFERYFIAGSFFRWE